MSTAAIREFQRNISLSGLSALIILGNVGNLFTTIIFTRMIFRQRNNSCSLYLLAASISSWIVINTGLISNVYGVDHVEPQHQSSVICKLRGYGIHVLLMISRSFVIAACIDRWASCSRSAKIRSFSQPKIARRVVPMIVLIWTIIPILVLFTVDIRSGRCTLVPSYSLAFSIYSLIVMAILPLFLMILFNVLAWHNLQSIRSRIIPIVNANHNQYIHKRDHNLMRMINGEVIVYAVTILLFPVNILYSILTAPFAAQKSEIRLAIESLVTFIINTLLHFTYCAAPFYVYIICSKEFRNKFMELFRFERTENENTGQIT